jgi:hypothetical protein
MSAAVEPRRYPLLEQPLPALCADRIDYALRDAAGAGLCTPAEAREFVAHLRVDGRRLVVKGLHPAEWFAQLFLRANAELWTGPQEAGSYWALAGAIRRAFDLKAFTNDDLFDTDVGAMEKLRSSPDPVVQAYLALLSPGTRFHVPGEGERFFTTHMKHRVLDPDVLMRDGDAPVPLTSVSERYRSQLERISPPGNVTYRLWSTAISDVLAEHLNGAGA